MGNQLFAGRQASLAADLHSSFTTDYARHIYEPKINQANGSVEEGFYTVNGDCLHIGKVHGHPNLQIRFSTSQNWIDVTQGDTLYRFFDRVYIRDVSHYMLPDHIPTVWFYTSFGTLIVPGKDRVAGMMAGFASCTVTLAADTVYTLGEAHALSGYNPVTEVGGDYVGGPIIFKVMKDSASPLGIMCHSLTAAFVDATNLFQIDVGENLVLDTDGFMGSYRYTAPPRKSRLIMQPIGPGLTCHVSLMFNRGARRTDEDFMLAHGLPVIPA